PYGLDVLIPENISTAGEKDVTWKSLELRISNEHRAFTRNLLKKYGIELTTTNVADNQPQPFDAQCALEVLDASFRHPIRLIANALGVPPKTMIDMGRKHGVPVAALVGAKEHALRQVAAGVDILVVQGTEAGAPVAFGLDRCMGSRTRQPRRAADAAAEHHQPRRLQLDRSRRGRRQCAGARSRQLFRRSRGRPDRQREIRGRRGAGIQGRFCRGGGAPGLAGGGVGARGTSFEARRKSGEHLRMTNRAWPSP